MSHNITVDGGTSVRLKTAGKYCDRDIVVTATGGGSSGDEWIGDGNTHIWISLPEGRTSPMFSAGVNGSFTVDWGDGSTDELVGTSTYSSIHTPVHTYAKAGDYIITLFGTGDIFLYGSSSSENFLVGSPNSSDGTKFAYSAAIRKVEIGDSVKRLVNGTFYACKALKSVAFSSTDIVVDGNTFYACYNLESITLPDTIASIGATAFGNSGLKSAVVSCIKAGTSAAMFSGCATLQSVVITNGVTAIGNDCFYNCTALSNVVVPPSVESVGDRAFNSCKSLPSLSFTKHTSVPSLVSTNAFISTPADFKIFVPSALVDEWKAATNWASYADKIVGV